MKLWRIWREPATRLILAYFAIVALGLEWSYIEHPELVDQVPDALVFRAGFAGAGVLVMIWAGSSIYIRVRKLEDRVRELEQQ